jgi:UPF0755 protein
LIRKVLKLGAALIGIVVVLGAFHFKLFLDSPLATGDAPSLLVVKPGNTIRTVARELKGRGWLKQPTYLVALAKFTNQDQKIHAGEFEVPPNIRPRELLDLLVSGKVVQHSLTVIEGWTFHQMMEAIRANPVLEQTLSGFDDAAIMARIGHPDEHPEGRFYPDTYAFPRGTTDVQFLQRAYRMMAERLAAEWEGRAEGLPLETPYEALILASIVERESAVPDERPMIAGVFIARLKKGMRLQTDPTVIYGMGEDFHGDIRWADLRRDTPYNTYTRRGLPPTPIALPSGDSLHATLHPAETDALYFVAKGDGSHHFSATLEEHNAAVSKYQLGGRRPKRAPEANAQQ